MAKHTHALMGFGMAWLLHSKNLSNPRGMDAGTCAGQAFPQQC